MIKPGSIGYEAWKKSSIPTKIKIYLFSVKNPIDVENGAKPFLEQIGPFTYREELERVNEVFHPNGSVSYESKKIWFYLSEESVNLDTIICTVNVPIVAAAEFARGNWIQEYAIGGMLKTKSSLFINVTARELLFEGYTDALLTMGSFFAQDTGIPMDKFGWFYERNGTTWSDGVVTMNTGQNDISKLGDIELWKGERRTMFDGNCGQIRGTAAGFLPPYKQRKFIDFFSTDICRPIRFDEDEKLSIMGVDSIKYSVKPEKTFGNKVTNPENACFNNNLPYGVQNSTGCKGGDTSLKTFVSLPHFHGADPFFVNQFHEGSLQPNQTQHSASISLQEGTSIPTEVLMRLQIVLQILPNPNIGSFLTNLSPVFLPVMWFDAEARITEDIASQLKVVGLMPTIAEPIGIASFLIGLTLIFVFIYMRVRRKPKGKSIEKTEVRVEKC